MAKPMTQAQIGQLGGFASARAVGHEAIVDRGSKGGSTTLERYGREHFIKAAHKRWGRLKDKDSTRGGPLSQPASAGERPAVPEGASARTLRGDSEASA